MFPSLGSCILVLADIAESRPEFNEHSRIWLMTDSQSDMINAIKLRFLGW